MPGGTPRDSSRPRGAQFRILRSGRRQPRCQRQSTLSSTAIGSFALKLCRIPDNEAGRIPRGSAGSENRLGDKGWGGELVPAPIRVASGPAAAGAERRGGGAAPRVLPAATPPACALLQDRWPLPVSRPTAPPLPPTALCCGSDLKHLSIPRTELCEKSRTEYSEIRHYVGRYTRRAALSNDRILAVKNDRRGHRIRGTTLSAEVSIQKPGRWGEC